MNLNLTVLLTPTRDLFALAKLYTCRKVMQQMTTFQRRESVARSLHDGWASCFATSSSVVFTARSPGKFQEVAITVNTLITFLPYKQKIYLIIYRWKHLQHTGMPENFVRTAQLTCWFILHDTVLYYSLWRERVAQLQNVSLRPANFPFLPAQFLLS